MTALANPIAFIDTNVWLYAFITGQDPPKTQLARQVLRSSISIIVSTQVINEVCINLVKKENYHEDQVRNIINDFYNTYTVIEINQTILVSASMLREAYRLSYWDGFIVASAYMSGASILYSEDMHDGLVIEKQVTILNPFK